MRDFAAEMPVVVRQRATALGEPGLAWLAELNDQVTALGKAWKLTPGAVLAGGSESLVMTCERHNGEDVILKVGLPGSADLAGEARVYELAAGRGYPSLIERNDNANAILLERLGAQLRDVEKDTDRQIAVICETLSEAWLPVPATANEFMRGAAKAEWLRNFINNTWQDLAEPCNAAVIERAMQYIDQRIAAHNVASAVLVHGDAHANNTLQCAGGAYKFVDPDGLFAEKACDLAPIMREYNTPLSNGDTRVLLEARAARLAVLTGIPEDAIWEWGFIERVSTGLVMLVIDLADEGQETLQVAERVV